MIVFWLTSSENCSRSNLMARKTDNRHPATYQQCRADTISEYLTLYIILST